MHLHGLPLSTLLQIGGVASLAIAALYVLELRRRAVPVPFAKLWESVLRDRETTSLFSKLRRILSLLLQLLLLALLVLALGDPREVASRTEGRHLVVLVDASASMQAIDVATPSDPRRRRIDEAKEEVQRIARGLDSKDRMLIAQMDATVTPLSTLTEDVAELEAALEKLAATDTRADLPRALAFAADVLRGLSNPEIVVVSDGALPDVDNAAHGLDLDDVTLSFVPVGKRGRNVAVTGLTVRRYPLDRDRYEVMLELYNGGEESEEVELRLLGDGELVDMTRLRLAPRERLARFYPNLSGASRTLEATVHLADGSEDDLPVDDRAFAVLPDVKRVRILCVTRGNTYLEAALLLASYLDVTFLDPERYPPVEGRFDVTIFDGVTPDLSPDSGNVLYLDPTGPGAPVNVAEKPLVNVGFDKVDKKSPLLRWTGIEDAFIGKARRLVPKAGDKVIGASDSGALLVSGKRDDKRFIALGFDPRDSDLVLRVAWPVFVLNVMNDLAAEDADYLSSYRTGEAWHVPVHVTAKTVTIESPSGLLREVEVQDGHAVVFGKEAGFHTLIAGPSSTETRFAANLADPLESTIQPRSTLTIAGKEATAVTGFHAGSRQELWIYLLLAAVALTTIEWFTYHRRLTV